MTFFSWFLINTENILFIAGGAFDGIDRVITRRLNMKAVGYSASKDEDVIDTDNLLQYIIPKDLKDFGLIPEIIGRLPVLTHMNPLDEHTLRAILTEPKNAIIKQYKMIDYRLCANTFSLVIKSESHEKLAYKWHRYKSALEKIT